MILFPLGRGFSAEGTNLVAEKVNEVVAKSQTLTRADIVSALHAEGDHTKDVSWTLLAEIVRMGLKDASSRQPFVPTERIPFTSLAPEMIPEDRRAWLKTLADQINPMHLRARIQDVVWVRYNDNDAGRKAINSYLDAAVAHPNGPGARSSSHYLLRSIALALTFLKGADERRTIADRIVGLLETATPDVFHFMLPVIDKLFEKKIADDPRLKALALRISDQCVERAKQLSSKWPSTGAIETASDFVDLARRISARLRDAPEVARMQLKSADLCLEQIAYFEHDNSSDLEKAGASLYTRPLYQEAIRFLKQTPEGRRRVLEVTTRYHRTCSYRPALFGRRSESFNAPDEPTLEEIARTPLYQALIRITSGPLPLSEASLKFAIVESRKKTRLSDILRFASEEDDYRGRKIAAADAGEPVADDCSDSHSLSEIDHLARTSREQHFREFIGPAIQEFLDAHTSSVEDISRVVRGSAFVPDDRLGLWTLGLSLTFQGHLLAGLHVIIPQIENSIREILNSAGVPTVNRAEGIEKEESIEDMIKHPLLGQIVGEDEMYDLQLLLTQKPTGQNLRNRLAHGLLQGGELSNSQGKYLFWLVLRIVFSLRPEAPAFIVH